MKNLIVIFFIFSFISINAQQNIKEGKVGYISSELIYVNFLNTEGIEQGDTLYLKIKNKIMPVLKVKYISSTSAACEKIDGTDFKSDMTVFANVKMSGDEIIKDNTVEAGVDKNEISPLKSEITLNNKEGNLSKYSGRYSIQSYSNIDNTINFGNYQRWRHSFRFSAENIGNSSFSFSTYTTFAYKADDWKNTTSNIGNALKIYDLNLNYRFSESSNFWLGRYLNRNIANISIVDGLQYEQKFSFLTTGIVIGSRPNFTDFGLNSKLFEYGIYLNRSDSLVNGYMENTFSVFQQTNNFVTDRRFAYLQHSNSIISNTSFFASAEIDLYKKELGVAKSDFKLTSLFLSARYSPVQEFSVNLSYDARKNVYYYETFKSISDSILENETRQGFRIRTTFRPVSRLSLNLQYGYRNSKSDLRPSKNYGGNISYFIPFLDMNTGLDYNKLNSNYIDGNVYSLYINKSLAFMLSDFSLTYRKTDYKFTSGNYNFDEKAIILDLSTYILNPLSLSISYEGAFESVHTTGRILIDLTARF